MTDDRSASPYEGWVILELMGHRRLAGYLTEQVIGAASLLRIDVPGPADVAIASQFYSPAAVYCITPTTEAMARRVAQSSAPAPVQPWELPGAGRTLPPADDPDAEVPEDADPTDEDLEDMLSQVLEARGLYHLLLTLRLFAMQSAAPEKDRMVAILTYAATLLSRAGEFPPVLVTSSPPVVPSTDAAPATPPQDS